VQRVPVELERDMTVVPLPLPDGSHLLAMVLAVLRAARMQADDAATQRAARALRGLTESQALRALRRVLRQHQGLVPAALEDLAREKRDLLGAGGLLELVDEAPALEAVGGLDQLKLWLVRRRDAMGERARAFGLPEPRGVLLLGVQGCGKSLSAKATAAVLGLPLARLDVARLFTRDFAPEENLRRALALAEALAPVVLWLDEIEKAFAGVGSAAAPDSALARVFGAFITWLSERRAPVFVAATANRVDALPPELLRKGRFDELFFVDLPDAAAREQILAIHLAARGRDPARFALTEIAEFADRRSGAELEQAVFDALATAFHEGRELTSADVRAAIEATVPLVETYEEEVKALREWARRRARSAASNRNLAELFHAAARAGLEERQRGPVLPRSKP
jgi:SpoVK/Ycf46/Vps4 family AAA+-type ATPase